MLHYTKYPNNAWQTYPLLKYKISKTLLQTRGPIITLGEGTTENVFMMRSGYSSRILEMSKVPMPDPVPPPNEWASWNPCIFKIRTLELRHKIIEMQDKTYLKTVTVFSFFTNNI